MPRNSVTDLKYNSNKQSMMTLVGATFHALVANGIEVGPVKFQDPDLNRISSIVDQIDSWRMFYSHLGDSTQDESGNYIYTDDEHPPAVMERLQKVREAIVEELKGVWANPSLKKTAMAIRDKLADFDTHVRNLGPIPQDHHANNYKPFIDALVDMRVKVWILVACFKNNLGSAIQVANLPEEIEELVTGYKKS
jgi:hypothetical protein